MQDPPSAAELIAAARDFFATADSEPHPKRRAFLARVAVNVLSIVERELNLAPAADAAELDRLRKLLDRDGSLEELNRELCRRIRAGEIGADPGLMAHLRATTLAKISIDQPAYSGHRAALEENRAER